MERAPKICGKCRYFFIIEEPYLGECHLKPPEVIILANTDPETMRPDVHYSDIGCDHCCKKAF